MQTIIKKHRGQAKRLLCIIILLFLMCGTLAVPLTGSTAFAADTEFRGVWVATVLKLNYPSVTTTDPEILKRDAIAILDNAKDMGFNAVFFQVRPASDALYKSDIFPWSKYLTGTQGLAPANDFDPLEFMVTEAHKRDIELHAWLNPYRITADKADNSTLSANHPARTYTGWVVTHSDGKMYWNPGEPGAQKLIADGVKEIVDNYDVDGIHIDDYFYPDKNFDDSVCYATFGSGYVNIADWRRANTETTVKNMYDIVKNSGKDMVFGVSPIGIWANKGSHAEGSDTKGNEAYFSKYADTKGWVKREIVDYIAPQIYWHIGFDIAEYKTLVNWWSDVVRGTNVKLYIGQAAYRVGNTDTSSPWHGVDEIQRQIEYNRAQTEVDGYAMYSYASFMGNSDLYNLIKQLNGNAPAPEPEPNPEPEVPAETLPFPDIKNHWAKDYIIKMYEAGVIKGNEAGNALPDANIKRADFVLMLTRMLGIEATASGENFIDIPKNVYYADAVRTAKSMGLISGIGDNMFAPEAAVTRQDMFTMTYRALDALNALNGTGDISALNSFTDNTAIADYAKVPLATFVAQKIVTGDNGLLKPLNTATRAETATILCRISGEGTI